MVEAKDKDADSLQNNSIGDNQDAIGDNNSDPGAAASTIMQVNDASANEVKRMKIQ